MSEVIAYIPDGEPDYTPDINTIEGMIEQKEIDVQNGDAFQWELDQLIDIYRNEIEK